MKKTWKKIFIISCLVLLVLALGAKAFVQSAKFASFVKTFLNEKMPPHLGIHAEFSKIHLKLVPPGVEILDPSISLKDGNALDWPTGIQLKAKAIDFTLQLFRLLTGKIAVNALNLYGAELKADVDPDFLKSNFKKKEKKKIGFFDIASRLKWENLFVMDFRSISLMDSSFSIWLRDPDPRKSIFLESYANELTLGFVPIKKSWNYDLALNLKDTQLIFKEKKWQLAHFQSSIEFSEKEVMIRNLSAQQKNLSVQLNGPLEGSPLKPELLYSKLNYVVRGPLVEWLALPLFEARDWPKPWRPLAGILTLKGNVKGYPLKGVDQLQSEFELNVDDLVLNHWDLRSVKVSGKFKKSTFFADEAKVNFPQGYLKVQPFEFNPFQETIKSLPMRLSFQDVSIRHLVGPVLPSIYPLHLHVNGDVALEMNLKPHFSIKATAGLKVRDFKIDNQDPKVKKPRKLVLSIPEIAVRADCRLEKGTFWLDQAELNLPHTSLQGKGLIGPNGFNLDILGNANLNDIGHIAEIPIEGKGDLNWKIRGPSSAVVFDFDLNMDDAKFLRLNLGKLNGHVRYDSQNNKVLLQNLKTQQGVTSLTTDGMVDVGETNEIAMTVGIPQNSNLSDLNSLMESYLNESVPDYPRELEARLNGKVKLSGKTDLDQLIIEGQFEFHNVHYWNESFKLVQMKAGYRKGEFFAEDIQALKKRGTLQGFIRYRVNDSLLDYQLNSHQFTTLDLDHLASQEVAYNAPMSIEVLGKGTIGQLKGQALVAIGKGVLKNLSIQPSLLHAQFKDEKTSVRLNLFGRQFEGGMDYDLNPNRASKASFNFQKFDFKPFLTVLNPALVDDPSLKTAFSGMGEIAFDAKSISSLSGKIAFQEAWIQSKHFSMHLNKPFSFEMKKGEYQLPPILLIGNETEVSIKGEVQSNQLDYRLQGRLNLSLLQLLVPEIASIKGNASLNMGLEGPLQALRFKAQVDLEKGDIRLRSLDQSVEDVSLSLRANDSIWRVERMKAKFGGGTLSGKGTVELFATRAPRMNLILLLDNNKMRIPPTTFTRASGKLHLAGDHLPYRVSGDLIVFEALVKENLGIGEDANARTLRTSRFLPDPRLIKNQEQEIFDLDLNVRADHNVFVKNDFFDVELRGNLRILNQLKTPAFLGVIEVLNGKVLFKDSFFAIQHARLEFHNPTAIEPDIDFLGHTEVKGYKISLAVNGKPTGYKLNFQSQPPLSQNDIVNLLTLGLTTTEYQNLSRRNREAYSRDEMYSLLFSQSGVNKKIQSNLGLKVRVDQSQMATPDNAFRARAAQDNEASVAPKVVIQKDITKNLKASVGSTVGVGDAQERSAGLEYQFPFSNKWSVVGTYEDQRGSQLRQQRTSVGADLKFKMRFK